MPELVSQELKYLRQRIRLFVEDTLRPLETLIGPNGEISEELKRMVRQKSNEAGFFAMTNVEESGSGAGPLELVVAREAFSATNHPLSAYVFGPRANVLRAAQGALRDKILEPMLRGEIKGAWAFTEPATPDEGYKPTFAVRDGDNLKITGTKSYVSGGERANFYSVLVNVEAFGNESGGTAIVVVERDRQGINVGPVFRSMDGSDHAEVHFDNVLVPLENVVGGIGEGMPRAMGNIAEERLEHGATASGICLWTIDYVTDYITRPHRSGTRLGDREGVRLRYSDMRVEAYAVRSMLYRTARLLDSGENAMNEVMATKVFCSEAAGRVVDSAVQLVGGAALVTGHPLELLYRRVRSMRMSGGASDILRLGIARGAIEFNAGSI